MRFAGYITAKDVRPSSVPENELQQIVKSNSTKLNFSVFKKFINEVGLTYHKDGIEKKYPHNKSYVVWYDPYVISNATFRFQLVFNNDKLVAIFHSRKLVVTGFKDTKLRGNYLLWVKNKDEKEMDAFINTYRKIHEVPD
jgi:hypothetical protein